VSISYALKEGLAGFTRARFAVAASTSAMAVSLVMIGLFLFLSYEAALVSSWLRQRVGEVEIFIDERASDAQADAVFQLASATPGVAEADFITREEAREIFLREFGEDAALFTDETFLPPSVRVRVQGAYANPDSLQIMIAEFRTWNRVDEVVFNQPLLVKVQQNIRLFGILGLVIGLVIVSAAIFLVANTIRLTIYARRLLIRTMKLVGATDSFIRRPFLFEGVAQGLIAGVIASAILWAIYSALIATLPQLALSPLTAAILLSGVVIVVGMALGWIGSLIAARRFIQKVSLH
jgi:cell division transport system permease protein